MPESQRFKLVFSPFHLPPDVDLLYRDSDVVPLEPRAVQVLRYLAEHQDRVVSKEELLEHVWSDVFTTDDVVKKAISQARSALGDDADNARFIKTYHARGYRFIVPVTLSHVEIDTTCCEGLISISFAEQSKTTPPQRLKSPTTVYRILGQSIAARDPDYDQLVGRDTELQVLSAGYRRTIKSQGQPVLITGEAGVGKTQLARYFGHWAQTQGALCLHARFFDYRGSQLAPYEVFLDLLRSAISIISGIDANGQYPASNDLRTAVKELCGVTLPEELFIGVGSSAGEPKLRINALLSDHFRAIIPLGKSFKNLSCKRPLIIFLDDLQWADEASRDIVGYLMRTSSKDPLMLVALARTEDTTDQNHPFVEWLKVQASYRSYSSIVLKPLDENDCRRAVEAMWACVGGLEIPSTDLRRLYQLTGGNPYFLTEMLRLLVAQGAISFADAPQPRWQWRGIKDLHLPETIAMAARAKLDHLSTEVRETVEQAAVIGDEFRVETLALMVNQSEDDLERLLYEGVRCGALSDRELSVGEDYRFYHATLRRVLYDSLPLRRRRRLHERAARALETVYVQEIDRVAEALSVHYEAAGDPQQTFDWGMRAWRASSARWHWQEAMTSIERAYRAASMLDRLGRDKLSAADRLALLLGLGEAYHSVGKIKESESILSDAVTLAQSMGDMKAEAAALLRQAQAQIEVGLYHGPKASTERALETYRRINNHDGSILCLIQLGNIEVHLGNYQKAAQLVEQVFEDARLDSQIAANAYGLRGWARTLQGRFAEGVPLLERALQYLDQLGDVRQRALLLRRLHWAHLSQGQYETAIKLAKRARDDFRAVGDLLYEAGMNMCIGQARVGQGLYDEGIEFLKSALERFQSIGAIHPQAESLWLLGRAQCEAGRPGEAAPFLQRALEMVRSIGDRDDEFRILTDIARLRISKKDYDGGLSAADQAVAIAKELNNCDGLGLALVERGRACLKLNRPEKALEAAANAVKLLDEAQSGERWRGYWALASVLDAVSAGKPSSKKQSALDALRRAVMLLEEMREQLDDFNGARCKAITQARAGPARDLHALLLRYGQTFEAKSIASRWLLDQTEVKRDTS